MRHICNGNTQKHDEKFSLVASICTARLSCRAIRVGTVFRHFNAPLYSFVLRILIDVWLVVSHIPILAARVPLVHSHVWTPGRHVTALPHSNVFSPSISTHGARDSLGCTRGLTLSAVALRTVFFGRHCGRAWHGHQPLAYLVVLLRGDRVGDRLWVANAEHPRSIPTNNLVVNGSSLANQHLPFFVATARSIP
jgi:hypothetical protein